VSVNPAGGGRGYEVAPAADGERSVTRIVVLDGFTVNPGDNPWDELASLGSLAVYDRTPPDAVVERARDAEILLTNKTPLPGPVLRSLPRLRFISVLATGYDVVDVATAAALGIPVANVPEYATDSVAQHVFALLLALTQHLREHDAAVHAGAWIHSPDFSFWYRAPLELTGKRMGIVGFGRIGQRVAELARAFRMEVLVTSRRRPEPAALAGATYLSRDELFTRADVVSLHCPLTPETEGMVSEPLLRRMQPTAFLINTARGRLIDEVALEKALREEWIAGAGLDVLSREPMPADHPLRAARHCLITPHIAWASLAARRRLMETTVRNVRAFLAGRPIHVVNHPIERQRG